MTDELWIVDFLIGGGIYGYAFKSKTDADAFTANLRDGTYRVRRFVAAPRLEGKDTE